jgi:hypothetical protein
MQEEYEDAWDHEPATENQLAFLNRLGLDYPEDIPRALRLT